MACHMAQQEQNLENRGGAYLFKQCFVASVAGWIVCVDEVVVALYRHTAVVVFAVVVRVVADGSFQLFMCHAVGFVVLVVEVEVQVAELAQFGHRVVLRRMGAFEHQRVDAVPFHGVDDLLLHLALVSLPADRFVALGEPWDLHLARHIQRRHRVGRHRRHVVLPHQAEETPPVVG